MAQARVEPQLKTAMELQTEGRPDRHGPDAVRRRLRRPNLCMRHQCHSAARPRVMPYYD